MWIDRFNLYFPIIRDKIPAIYFRINLFLTLYDTIYLNTYIATYQSNNTIKASFSS